MTVICCAVKKQGMHEKWFYHWSQDQVGSLENMGEYESRDVAMPGKARKRNEGGSEKQRI